LYANIDYVTYFVNVSETVIS